MGKLLQFLGRLGRASTPLVYIGWGSMVSGSREFMACLAVRSLMIVKARGVILSGWVELDSSLLEGQTDSAAMKEFCEENVLFVASAPHEWIFPQCAAIVHHGGAGTLVTSMRSGVPTIVTPVALDQFANGSLAEDNGVGFKTCQLSKVTPSILASALSRCMTDTEIIQKAKAMGEKLRAENGVANAVKLLEDFILDDVDTGKYKASVARFTEQISQIRARPMGCFAWIGQLCCSPRPLDFIPK